MTYHSQKKKEPARAAVAATPARAEKWGMEIEEAAALGGVDSSKAPGGTGPPMGAATTAFGEGATPLLVPIINSLSSSS